MIQSIELYTDLQCQLRCFYLEFSFHIGSAEKFPITVPHSKFDEGYLGSNKELKIQQFSHDCHWHLVRGEQMPMINQCFILDVSVEEP